jgi:hypothetical protein
MLKETLEAIRLEVTVDGTKYEGDLRPGDLVRYEEHFGKSMLGGLDNKDLAKLQDEDPANPSPEAVETLTGLGLGMIEMFYLGFLSVRRQVTFADYDDFLDRVEDIGIGAKDDTGKAVAPAPSPSS